MARFFDRLFRQHFTVTAMTTSRKTSTPVAISTGSRMVDHNTESSSFCVALAHSILMAVMLARAPFSNRHTVGSPEQTRSKLMEDQHCTWIFMLPESILSERASGIEGRWHERSSAEWESLINPGSRFGFDGFIGVSSGGGGSDPSLMVVSPSFTLQIKAFLSLWQFKGIRPQVTFDPSNCPFSAAHRSVVQVCSGSSAHWLTSDSSLLFSIHLNPLSGLDLSIHSELVILSPTQKVNSFWNGSDLKMSLRISSTSCWVAMVVRTLLPGHFLAALLKLSLLWFRVYCEDGAEEIFLSRKTKMQRCKIQQLQSWNAISSSSTPLVMVSLCPEIRKSVCYLKLT